MTPGAIEVTLLVVGSGGLYPGAGITIGPALTFGYIAAQHAVSVAP